MQPTTSSEGTAPVRALTAAHSSVSPAGSAQSAGMLPENWLMEIERKVSAGGMGLPRDPESELLKRLRVARLGSWARVAQATGPSSPEELRYLPQGREGRRAIVNLWVGAPVLPSRGAHAAN